MLSYVMKLSTGPGFRALGTVPRPYLAQRQPWKQVAWGDVGKLPRYLDVAKARQVV